MKLVTFRPHDASAEAPDGSLDRSGVLVERHGTSYVLDLAAGFAWLEALAGRPHDAATIEARYGAGVLGFIEHAGVARPAADELVRLWQGGALPEARESAALWRPLGDVTLRAPLPRPPSLRDGYAFRQHVETVRRHRGLPMIPEFDLFPVFYFSNHRAIVGPGDVRVRREHLDRLDYELEAAIVVGQGGANLRATDDAIFGMTIMNDWSARGLQAQEMKLNLGPAKGKDFATSLGPWLVTLDELAPRGRWDDTRGWMFDLEMRATVNGKPLSRGNLGDMSWSFGQIMERASLGVELTAGDVVGSGTCGTGCLLELNASGAANDVWLQPGDVVVLEIDGLGRLENRVVLG